MPLIKRTYLTNVKPILEILSTIQKTPPGAMSRTFLTKQFSSLKPMLSSRTRMAIPQLSASIDNMIAAFEAQYPTRSWGLMSMGSALLSVVRKEPAVVSAELYTRITQEMAIQFATALTEKLDALFSQAGGEPRNVTEDYVLQAINLQMSLDEPISEALFHDLIASGVSTPSTERTSPTTTSEASESAGSAAGPAGTEGAGNADDATYRNAVRTIQYCLTCIAKGESVSTEYLQDNYDLNPSVFTEGAIMLISVGCEHRPVNQEAMNTLIQFEPIREAVLASKEVQQAVEANSDSPVAEAINQLRSGFSAGPR